MIKVAVALGIGRLTIKGDSQLLVNFTNKECKLKDEHMAVYLEEVRKIKKQFLGLELQHVLRDANKEADDIAKRASCHEPQSPSVFEGRVFRPSATPQMSGTMLPQEELPLAQSAGTPAYDPTTGARLLLAMEPWRAAGPRSSRRTYSMAPCLRRRRTQSAWPARPPPTACGMASYTEGTPMASR